MDSCCDRRDERCGSSRHDTVLARTPLRLIGNGPFMLRLVWSAAPKLLTLNLIARAITALIPVATLGS
jgi:hypothetical protein